MHLLRTTASLTQIINGIVRIGATCSLLLFVAPGLCSAETKVSAVPVDPNDGSQTRPTEPATAPAKITLNHNWIAVRDLSVNIFSETGLENLAIETDVSTIAEAKLIRTEPGEGWKTNDLPGKKLAGPFRVILTKEMREKFIAYMERRSNVDLLSAPKTTTLSGREALISILDTQSVETGFATNSTAEAKERLTLATEQMEFGSTVNVLAREADNGAIHVRVEGRVREFIGYDDSRLPEKVDVWDNGRKIKTKVPLPMIREQRYLTEATVNNGETILLCGLAVPEKRRTRSQVALLGDTPLLGRLFRSESEETYYNQLILLVHVQKE